MKQIQSILLIMVLIGLSSQSYSQILTKEDSLSAGLTGRTNSYSVLSGYGEAKVNYDLRMKTGTANLTRNVIFFGHKFSNSVYFFSELELEDAKVKAGQGEISLEQFFLKFSINPSNYVVSGLFIPRIGLINENHLPTTFNGNDRPFVERLVIPATWRELGVAYYGISKRIMGLNYSLALMNGLNSANFKQGSGIRNGRASGSNASASNIALSGALLYYTGNFRFQISTYYGGSSGLNQANADTMGLNNGMFGTPVNLNEANVRFSNDLYEWKAMIATVAIKDAEKINAAYNTNTPKMIYGAYAEFGLHLLEIFKRKTDKELTLFTRLESLDLNYKTPNNLEKDGYQRKMFSITGITFAPVAGVVLKADYVWRKTGDFNSIFYKTNPNNNELPFYTNDNYINLGFGYSF